MESKNLVKRTPCEIYTRVMGYMRPVSNFNIGKKSEFYSRKYFLESKTKNSEFIRKYGTGEGINQKETPDEISSH